MWCTARESILKWCRVRENVSGCKRKKTPIGLWIIFLRVSWAIVQANKRQIGLLKTGDEKGTSSGISPLCMKRQLCQLAPRCSTELSPLEALFLLPHHLWHTYLMKNYLNINLPRQVVEDFLCHARRHCFPAAPYDKNIKLRIKFTIGRFSLDFHWTLNQTKNTWPWRALILSPWYGHVVLVSG